MKIPEHSRRAAGDAGAGCSVPALPITIPEPDAATAPSSAMDAMTSKAAAATKAALDLIGTPQDLLATARALIQHAHDSVAADAVTDSPRHVPDTARVDLEDVARTTEQVLAATHATQAVTLARYAALEDRLDNADTGETGLREYPLGHQAEYADTDLAAALGCSPRAATGKLQDAITACTHTPALMRRAVAGDLPWWRVVTVGKELGSADPETARLVDAHLAGVITGTWSATKLRTTTAKLLQRVQPDAVRQAQAKHARREIGVWVRPHHLPGLSELHAVLPTAQTAELYAAVDALAHDTRTTHNEELDTKRTDAPNDQTDRPSTPTGLLPKTLGQHRADALTDLVLNGCTIDTHIVAQVPVIPDTVLSQNTATTPTEPATSAEDPTARPKASPDIEPPPDETTDHRRTDSPGTSTTQPIGPPGTNQPAQTTTFEPEQNRPGSAVGGAVIPGVGTVPADILDQIIGRFTTKLSRTLVDAHTGVTIETSSRSYTPPPAMRRFVEQRDGTCRFPTCAQPAHRCDLDHVTPWHAGGETTPANLQALCRHHHRVKTDGRWRVTMTDDGVCTWTSPTCRQYVTHPERSDPALAA